jgi:cytochrome P450
MDHHDPEYGSLYCLGLCNLSRIPDARKFAGASHPTEGQTRCPQSRHAMKAKILARMRKGEGERRDFCSYIFRIKDEMALTDWNMAAYSNALILAGSETSATVLSALTYFLCRTPRVYEKLKKEVRSRYKSSSEITSLTATFPYLTAVIHEAMRMYPPVPFGMPRVVPRGGETVDGLFIPEGVSLFVDATDQAEIFLDNCQCPSMGLDSQYQELPRSRQLYS